MPRGQNVGVGQKVTSEVIPVPAAYLPKLWPDLKRTVFRQNGGGKLDLNQLYGRLLLEEAQLWLALYTSPIPASLSPYSGVIVTRVSERPPTQSKLYARVRSLSVHLVTGRSLESWIDSAVERISQYGQEQGCRQVFVTARKGWRTYALRFFGRFETMGYGRDRPTRCGTGKHNRPGLLRRVEMVAPERDDFWRAYKQSRKAYVRPNGAPRSERRKGESHGDH